MNEQAPLQHDPKALPGAGVPHARQRWSRSTWLFFLGAIAVVGISELRGWETRHAHTLMGLARSIGGGPPISPSAGERFQAWVNRETGLGPPYPSTDELSVNGHNVEWSHGWPLPYLERATHFSGSVASRATSPWAFDEGVTQFSVGALAVDIVALALISFVVCRVFGFF